MACSIPGCGTSNAMPREDGMVAGSDAMVARTTPDTRAEWPARGAPWTVLAAFARRKPLGAVGGLIVLALVLTALLAPLISPHDPRRIIREADNRVPVYVAPSPAYPMGTDHVGRDILSRIIYGARISLYVGLGSVLIGVTGWFLVGMISAYAGPRIELVVQRVVDAMMAVPGLIVVLAIMAVLGSSLNNVIIAIVIGMLAPVVRTVRSQVLSVKETEYVVAARAIGARSARIILQASLSFLGVGVPPDVPSWGGMLTAAAQGHITKAPWAGIFPGLAIFIVVLGFNLLGDALRDVLEPRLRGARRGLMR